MQGNVRNYLNGIAADLPTAIISPETYSKIYNMTALFRDFAASEYIMETHLNTEVAEVDFSFRLLAKEKACLINGLKSKSFSVLSNDNVWMKIIDFINYWPLGIEDIWFEMDYGEYEKPIPQPCFFFNAARIKKGKDIDDNLLFDALKQLLVQEQLVLLRGNIESVVQHLPPEVGLFQVGTMLARNKDRVRVFTEELTKEQTAGYLSAIGWTGSFSELNRLFQLVQPYGDGRYIVDFDVTNQGISEKIGINFGLESKQTLPAFLDHLVKHRLCVDIKRKGVAAWSGSRGSFLGRDYGFTALIKDISHFKISHSPKAGLQAKAYLRIAGVYLKEWFKPKQPGYREMQNVLKEIAKKSMLDKEYRDLCLKDSQAAIRKITGSNVAIPDNIIFLEEDGESVAGDCFAYILPPFLKKTWLSC